MEFKKRTSPRQTKFIKKVNLFLAVKTNPGINILPGVCFSQPKFL